MCLCLLCILYLYRIYCKYMSYYVCPNIVIWYSDTRKSDFEPLTISSALASFTIKWMKQEQDKSHQPCSVHSTIVYVKPVYCNCDSCSLGKTVQVCTAYQDYPVMLTIYPGVANQTRLSPELLPSKV